MPVKITVRGKEHEVRSNQTVKKILKEMGLPSEAYLVLRNGELVTEDIVLLEGDVVKLIAVISGGSSE